ncbi:MAG TPA: sigma-54 dependent transcriptional regulator [Kofleriaceae bacterium]|nr:sigma-54 dependent transcriptional regulator [Kofleriaceae bacterium]
MNGTILIVDDDEDTAVLLRDLLRKRGLDVTAVSSAQECLEQLRGHPTDVVVTDVHMPGMSGIDLCATLRERHPDLLPIIVTGHSDPETAIAAIRAGAFDFITKPLEIRALEIAVSRALEHLALKREVKRLRGEVHRDETIDGIAGNSRAIRNMVDLIQRVASSDASVLITGESGTGKELVARALHHLSPRRDRPFVAMNCAAMPASLLESELFGHVRGAFTDARHDRKGLFVSAEGGTILLDEIGEMPIEMQVKLLRVLQERMIRPVGGDQEVPFDVRVLTSTNRDLETEVHEKRFREDLFYRVNVVQIAVPSLRDRAGDILALAQRFITQIAARSKKPVRGLSAKAAQLLMDYDWPGNVRELENCMERAVALCRLDEITADDLPTKVQEHGSSRIDLTADASRLPTMEEMERRYIRQVLQAVAGNKTHAARVLGLDRRSLYRRLDGAHALAAPAVMPGWRGAETAR